MSEINKEAYLGDGVYSDFDGYQIKLTTGGGGPRDGNTIYLEPEVVSNLIKYIDRINEHLRRNDASLYCID